MERRVAVLVIGISAAVIAFWVTAALLMTGRGFDLTDEGYYLLSYRWWSSTPRTFTGVQYLYGPVFELFGYDVRALRAFRLLTILGTHAIFAWAFMTWLRSQGIPAVARPVWMWAGGLAIVASGGITYGRLPLSPGYNDVALLGSLLLVAVVLRTLVGVRQFDGRLPWAPAVAAPPVMLVMVLAKWASGVIVIVFIGVLALFALRAIRPVAGVRRWLVIAACSTAASLLVANVVVGGFGSAIPPIVRINRLVASSTNSPATLIWKYVTSGMNLVALSLLVCAVPLALGLAAMVASRLGHRRTSFGVAVATPFVVVGTAMFLLHGSSLGAQVSRYSACLVGLAFLVLAALLLNREDIASGRSTERDGTLAVLILLVCLPPVQAFGTGNPLFAIAVDEFAAWMALFVLACGVLVPGRTRVFIGVTTLCAVVVAGVSGGFGLLVEPYRTAAFVDATTKIEGSGPAADLKVGEDEAQDLARVRMALNGQVLDGRPMVAYDELPGLVFALGGRSVGEAWYSRLDRERSAANLRDACRHGNPWGDRQPIVLYNRRPAAVDVDALAACGIDLRADYRHIDVEGFGTSLSIYLPRGERIQP